MATGWPDRGRYLTVELSECSVASPLAAGSMPHGGKKCVSFFNIHLLTQEYCALRTTVIPLIFNNLSILWRILCLIVTKLKSFEGIAVMSSIRFVLFGAVLSLFSTASMALPFHYLIDAGSVDPIQPIIDAGHTPVGLTDLAAGDLAGVSVLWITNGSNSGAPTQVVDNAAALADWVFAGGVLSYHDRYVSGGPDDMAALLPGAAGTVFVRNFEDDEDINLLDPLHPVAAGLDDTTLDGGNSSSHGYATLASLPTGAMPLFSRGAADEIVDFFYGYGAGWVYYSTIPIDFYLGGGNDFSDLYAPNEAAFQASLAGAVTGNVPAPGVLGLLGIGLIALRQLRRRTA